MEDQLKYVSFEIFWDFDKWPLKGGWLLNRGPLYRGLTVFKIKQNIFLCVVSLSDKC